MKDETYIRSKIQDVIYKIQFWNHPNESYSNDTKEIMQLLRKALKIIKSKK